MNEEAKDLSLSQGSDDWRKMRKLVTETIPGKKSALYNLNALVLGKAEVVPMTHRAHLALCLFTEGATGIPEVDGARIKIILVPRGVGKALALDTPVPTPRGWSTMGDLRVGDEVFGPDGKATKVLEAFPTLHGRTCYKVSFDSGEEIIADAEHLWSVNTIRSVVRAGAPSEVMTTEEMRHQIFYRRLDGSVPTRDNTNNLRIKRSAPWEYPEGSPLPMHPYVLGAWLGDGTSESPTITSADQEILDRLALLGYPTHRVAKTIAYRFDSFEVTEALRMLNVFDNKHIPDIYLRASFADRLELLRGLMDTDGYASHQSNMAWFYNTNHALARAVLTLCASLGLKPRWKEGRARVNGKDCGPKYEVSMRPGDEAVFHLTRKASRIKPPAAQRRRHEYRVITAIESVESVPVRCIRVDHPTSLFLVGETGIATHNSSLVTKALPILRILRNPEYATGIANETAELAMAFLGDMKNEIESNVLLQTLFPEVIPDFKNTIWKADRAITQRKKSNPTSPTFLATGVGGTKTGVHMNEWICDDVLSQNAAEAAFRGNNAEIEATNRWIPRLQPMLKNPKRDPLLFIGTRWWEGDSYEFIEEYWGRGEEDRTFNWALKLPAQKMKWDEGVIDRPPETQNIKLRVRGEVAIFKFPAIDENGRPIFPERYDVAELQAMQEEDPVFYAGQYLLEPTAGAASVLDPKWLKTYEWDGANVFFTDNVGAKHHTPLSSLTTYISVDPAFSKKTTSARTAIPVVGTDGERLFLLEDFAERLDSEDDIAAKVVDFYRRYKPQKIFVETIVAQVAVANAIRRRFREEKLGEPPIEEIRSHGVSNKVMRIFGLEHYFKRGIFYYHPNHRRFFQEYIAFPRAILRDVLDAISFQKDTWESVFTMTHFHGTPMTKESIATRDAQGLARVKEAWSRRRRR